jgi:hypothetical protein
MSTAAGRPRTVGPRIATDLDHGGRWTSLVCGGREWLWHRHEPRRAAVRPGDPFADAGGVEECVPTIRGRPDHGHAWSRRWTREEGTDRVDWQGAALERRITEGGTRTVVDYRLVANPGYRFVWAAHALLDVSAGARVDMPDGAQTRAYPDTGSCWVPARWPALCGVRMDRLGRADGSALGAVVATGRAAVHDGPDTLAFTIESEDAPVCVALWRNLGGFPATAPYRSVGVEPMLGRVLDLATAGDNDAARVPATGELRWRLTLTAAHTPGEGAAPGAAGAGPTVA